MVEQTIAVFSLFVSYPKMNDFCSKFFKIIATSTHLSGVVDVDVEFVVVLVVVVVVVVIHIEDDVCTLNVIHC
jgi:hypothetical protein